MSYICKEFFSKETSSSFYYLKSQIMSQSELASLFLVFLFLQFSLFGEVKIANHSL